jgi:hypothetical protein
VRRPLTRTLAVVALASAAVAGCSTPEETPPEDAPADEATDDDVTAERPEPVREELVALIAELSSAVDDAQDQLEAAQGADDAAAARSGADGALDRLLDDPATTSTSPMAVFPAVSAERESSGEQDDLLTAVLSTAREAGGDLGRDAVETMRDPVAGDLGAGERDAEGMVAELQTVTAGVGDLDAAAEAVEGFQGDGTRALAWTLVVAGTTDADLAREAAERATGHLGVVQVALSLLADQAGDGAAAPDDADDAETPEPQPEVPDDAPDAPPEPDDAPDDGTPGGADEGADDDTDATPDDGPSPDEVPDDLQPDDLPDPDAEPVGAQG